MIALLASPHEIAVALLNGVQPAALASVRGRCR